MAKLQFLLRPEGEDIEAFGARVRSDLVPALLARGPAALKATFTEVRPPPLSVIPFQRRPVALFSIWTDGDDPAVGGDAGVWADVIDPGGRGQVAGYRVEESPELDAIVEEQFAKAAHLLDPTKFFGGPLRMVPNMIRVAVDIAGFIDLRTMRTWLVSELYGKTGDAAPP